MNKLILICIILLSTSKALPFLREVANHHPLPSGKINDSVAVINTGMANFYVISHGQTRICIDAGSNLRRAQKELTKLQINPSTVTTVFLTHTDHDHIAALSLFPNARIYLSHTEEEMVRNKKRRLFGFFYNKLPLARGSAAYHGINDGDEMNVEGIRVKAIATPGHTFGSTSYLVNEHTLFTGDTLSLVKGKAAIFTPSVFNMDENKQAASIRKLRSLQSIKLLCTGHHGVTDNFTAALAEWE